MKKNKFEFISSIFWKPPTANKNSETIFENCIPKHPCGFLLV